MSAGFWYRGAMAAATFGSARGATASNRHFSGSGAFMTAEDLNGLRVLALESRRSEEIAKLIRNHGGEPRIAPAMREVPLESNTEALEFAGRLIRGDYDKAFEQVDFLVGPTTPSSWCCTASDDDGSDPPFWARAARFNASTVLMKRHKRT